METQTALATRGQRQERRQQPRGVVSTLFEKMNSELHIFIQSCPENTITINLSLENE